MSTDTDAATGRDEDAEFEAAFEEFSAPPGREPPESPDEAEDLPEEEAEEAEEPEAREPEPENRSREQQLESELAQMRHALTSDRGRISALQKKLDALQSPAAPQPSRKQVTQAMQTPAAWDSFKEDYPDIAEAIEGRFSAFDERLSATLEPVARTQAELSAAKAQADETREVAALTSAREQGGYGHADYVQVVNSSAYQQWIGRQPAAVQGLAESPHAADAAFLLDAFKASPAWQPPADTGLAERRARKLAAAASVGGSKSGPTEIAEDDFEAAFNAFAARRDRSRQRA